MHAFSAKSDGHLMPGELISFSGPLTGDDIGLHKWCLTLFDSRTLSLDFQ